MDLNEDPQLYREIQVNEAIRLDDEWQLKCLEKKIEELHRNVRHITQLGMGWFSFFVTINYVTLGWLAKDAGAESVYPRVIWIVAVLFYIQNLLGILGIDCVQRASERGTAQVTAYEKLLLRAGNLGKEGLEATSSPANLYILLAWSLKVVMFLLMVSWALIGVYYSR